MRSIDKIASNYTVRAGFGIGFSLRCWRFCQLANCFFVFALVSPALPPPYLPVATPTHVPEATAAGGAGTLARAAWQSFYFVRVWILFSWHSNTYAPPLLPFLAFHPRLWPGGTGLVIKYAGYQCQWCQKSTPAAKVARKAEEAEARGRRHLV